jgi:hypothetical protein
MTHNGVEAPYEVVESTSNLFTVYFIEDEDRERPVAERKRAYEAELITLEHYNKAVL